MGGTAMQILEQFRKLTPLEQRELFEVILHECGNAVRKSRTIAEIAGKYEPLAETVETHDGAFADAILSSKAGRPSR